MSKPGKRLDLINYLTYSVEIRKGKIFYKAYVLDINGNTCHYGPFFWSYEEALREALDWAWEHVFELSEVKKNA